MLDIACSVRDFFSKARDDRTDRAKARAVTRRPHTVMERLSDTILDRLLLLCRLSDDDNLPPLYHAWAV
jgi:hypothetical protein